MKPCPPGRRACASGGAYLLLQWLAIMLAQIARVSALSAVLCYVAHASAPPWIELRSPHFTVITDSNEKQARHTLDQFERMRWMFHTLFPDFNVDPVSPVVVLAARSSKGFEALEPEAYLAKGQMKLSGLFMRAPDKNYVLLRLDGNDEHPFSAVYHEYTHMQFAAADAWMPIWLNEGFAQFFQNTEIRDKDVQLGEADADSILYLRQNRLIPLPVLFKVDHNSPYYHEEQKGSVFYAESWALTHFLFITDRLNHTNKIWDYLTLLSHHEDPVIAAEKSFGDLKRLQSALEEYIGRSSYQHFVVSSAAALIDESSYKVRALTGIEYDAARADVLAYVQRENEARELLDSVLKADPNNTQARETMGFLELREGHREEARKWYGETVKLGSQNYLAYYYYASLSNELGGAEEKKEIEESLRAAIRLNPRFSEAYEPLASVLMSEDRTEGAIAVLQALAKATTRPAEVAAAQKRIAQIKQMQAALAQENADAKAQADVQAKAVLVAEEEARPRHPTEPPDGSKHEMIGVIRSVRCSYPAVIEFQVEDAKRRVSLYSNDYFKLDFSTLGLTIEGNLSPCTGIEGMKARVQYAESSDKSVDGQAIAIELRK